MDKFELLTLASNLLDENKTIKIRATGSSMLPLFREGDEFIIENAQTKGVKRGDLVVFELNNTLVVHRIFKRSEERKYICWGDFNPKPDTEIDESQIVAQVISFERAGRVIKINGIKFKIWSFFINQFAPLSHHFMIQLARIYIKIKLATQIKQAKPLP